MKILVIEDIEDMHATIAARLSLSGLTISEIAYATTRHDGCNEATCFRPDVILYDLGSPDSTPEESRETLRQFTNRFCVVILSGQKEELYWRPCVQESGAMDYLPKVAFLAPGAEPFLGHAILNAWFRFNGHDDER